MEKRLDFPGARLYMPLFASQAKYSKSLGLVFTTGGNCGHH